MVAGTRTTFRFESGVQLLSYLSDLSCKLSANVAVETLL